MNYIDRLRDFLGDDLDSFEEMFAAATGSEDPLLRPVMENFVTFSGKKLRPALTLLVARMCGEVNKKQLAAAVIVEVLHNASLVHDDVLDEAYVRRGEPTALAMMRSKGAVLAGDYLLTQAMSIGVKFGNYRAIDVAAGTLARLVSGELDQMRRALLLDTTREDYFRIIRHKTAYLLGAAALLGVDVEAIGEGNQPSKQAQEMEKFGEKIGMAFQIQDDILDMTGVGTGKARYNDIRERKITLPLIIAIERRPERRKELFRHLRAAASEPTSIEWIVAIVNENQGIEGAAAVAQGLVAEALALLEEAPQNEATEMLRQYAEFMTGRTR